MALPLLLGIVIGAGAVIAYNKSDKLKAKGDELFEKSKELASDAYGVAKEKTQELKDKVEQKIATCKDEKKHKSSGVVLEEVILDEVGKKPRGRKRVEKDQ